MKLSNSSSGKAQSEESTLDDSTGSRSCGPSSGVYYARVLLKRWRWRCCCTASCCVAVPLMVGLVAYCAGGAQNAPFFRGGRLSGSTLVDVSEQPTLLASLNRSVEPCHNFYRFVCDGWMRRAGEKLTLVEELALTARRNAATLLRHVEVPVVEEMNAVHKAALLMQKCLLLSRRPPRPEVLLAFMASMGLTWPQPTTMNTSGLISLMVHMSLSWDLNAVFELQLLPTPRAAGGRPRWSLSPSSQLKSWRRERRNLGPEYLTRIRQYVEGFSDARVHELMPLAAGKPFADEAAWDLALIEELFEASKRSYRERIGRSAWMDEAARRFADDKIRLVQGVVPAPELIWNASAFERIYDCVPQSREQFFLPSLLETRRCKQRLLLITAASGQTSAETITWTSPAVHLVRYLDVYNSVAIMGSVLYPPVLQVSGDYRDVFNYAGLAFLFSRLLFGAIDQRGSLRDSTGSPRPWWSNATREGYSRAVRCFEDLYQFDARYVGDDIGAAVATSVAFAAYEQRLRDLYARNSGLWAGLRWLSWPRWLRRARRNEFADDKAFFMNHCLLFCSRRASRLYSDGWITAEQKCNLPLKNSPDFWRAFGCREGDAMRAEKSCELI
ncbi:neprilysin-1-like [Dermacentor variabilis]|uniref:neprilysin-1-like n=1 Tax=Dermacentor variabilis TaxID=34621 RepID=UPI003F5CA2AA